MWQSMSKEEVTWLPRQGKHLHSRGFPVDFIILDTVDMVLVSLKSLALQRAKYHKEAALQ